MKGIKKLNKQQGRQAVEADTTQFFIQFTFSSLSMACTHLIYLKSPLTNYRQKGQISVIIRHQVTQSHPCVCASVVMIPMIPGVSSARHRSQCGHRSRLCHSSVSQCCCCCVCCGVVVRYGQLLLMTQSTSVTQANNNKVRFLY